MAGVWWGSTRAAALVAAVAIGCSADSTRPATETAAPRRVTSTSASTAASTSTSTAVPVPPTTLRTRSPSSLSMPDGLDGPMSVIDVVDGDTVKVSNGTTLRLIGVDTPETVDPRKPVQCFGREASARAHALLDGARVHLEYDPTQGRLDRYGRTLAYVWMADGRLYNETIIAEGYAHEYTYAIPYRYRDAFLDAQRSARDTGRGLWSPSTCAGDTTEPAGAGSPRSDPSGCDLSYPGVCIPPAPPDLDCGEVPFRRFAVTGTDPHRFDSDRDGIGCE